MTRRDIILALAIATSTTAGVLTLAQQPAPAPTPALSTADRVALQSLEKQKQEAYAVIQNASQEEMAIAREFIVSHPGFHLNPTNFVVEKDPEQAKPSTTAPAAKN